MLTAEDIREYCIAKSNVEECMPFGPDNLVFKVNGRMFALLSLDAQPLSVNLKCDPDKAVVLREDHSFVLPGYHMNKKHWNTVVCEARLRKDLLFSWIDESYDLVDKPGRTTRNKGRSKGKS